MIIDDVVTTGSTACAIITPVLRAFPDIDITVFSLGWTPTYRQQIALGLQKEKAMYVSEPEGAYGGVKRELQVDEDFECGETNVSIWPERVKADG
jgi:hypothetical protein